MPNYIYKQYKGALSRNNIILKEVLVSFLIQYGTHPNPPFNFNVGYIKCGDCYRFKIYLDNVELLKTLTLDISTCNYQMWIYTNEKYVYKDGGKIVIDLSSINSNEIWIDLKTKKETAIMLTIEYEEGEKTKKVIMAK